MPSFRTVYFNQLSKKIKIQGETSFIFMCGIFIYIYQLQFFYDRNDFKIVNSSRILVFKGEKLNKKRNNNFMVWS